MVVMKFVYTRSSGRPAASNRRRCAAGLPQALKVGAFGTGSLLLRMFDMRLDVQHRRAVKHVDAFNRNSGI